MDNIDLTIRKTMAVVFQMSKESITPESRQDSIRNWDSVKHLDLVISLEEEFNIVFPAEEIGNLVSFKLIKIIVEEQLALC